MNHEYDKLLSGYLLVFKSGALCFQFVNVLNSKKAKLRELRDRLSKQEARGKLPEEEDVSGDETEQSKSETDDGSEETTD